MNDELAFIDQLLASHARTLAKVRAEGRGLATRCSREAIDSLLDRRLLASALDGAER